MAVSAALFVSTLPPSAVPYLFILPACAIVPALLVYNRVAARFRLDQMIIGSNSVLLVGVVAFELLLYTPYDKSFAALAALYLFIEIAYTLVILQFWNLASQIFNPREARRLFGVIAAGGTLANVAAGLVLVALVQLLGVENLLWVVAFALLVCIACAYTARQWQHSATAANRPAERGKKHIVRNLRAIGQSPLLIGVAGLTILLSLLINIGAYEFFLSLQSSFAGREAELTAYLGAFESWAGLAAFFVQLYLTGRVMTRYGVFAALLFFPLGTAAGAAAALLTGGALMAMAFIRAADPTLRRTINSAALNVLFLPVPTELRERAKELFEGLYAASFGLVGVAFLLLQRVPGWDYRYYSIPLLVLAAAWVALLGWTRRQYTRALADSLKRRVLDLEGATIDISDETTVRVLAVALQDADELRVVHALQLIAGAPAVNWDAHVAPLLAHPSATVRIMALGHLGRAGNVEHGAAVARLLDAAETDVRAAAIEAFCGIMGPAAGDRVAPFMAEADPRVKGAAVAGLLQHGDSDGARRAVAELNGMLVSGDAPMRQAGARTIGQVRAPELSALLVPLFGDASRAVRLSAIRAAGELRQRALLPELIRALGDKAVAPAAVEALANFGGGIEPHLAVALQDPASGAFVVRILAVLRTRPAVDLLLAAFHAEEPAIRGAVYRALAQLRAEGWRFDLPDATVRAAIVGELRGAYATIVLREDLGADGLDLLLADAIGKRLGWALDRTFYLLNLLYPRDLQAIRRARAALQGAPGSTRALAIELLDHLAERQIAELLLPLVEAPIERLLEIARKRFNLERCSLAERLAELARGSDPWLRTCGLFRIGVLKQADASAAVLAALDAADPLIRETALVAWSALIDAERAGQLPARV